MVLGKEGGQVWKIIVNGSGLGQVSHFKYLRYMVAEFGTYGAEYRKVVSGRKVAVAIISQVNTQSLQLGCTRVLYEALVVPIILYGERKKNLRLELYRCTLEKQNADHKD